MADPRDILVEVVYTFGAEASRYSCTLGEGTPGAMRELFSNTVEQALRETPNVWERPGARRYVLKQVARIGRESARVARQTPGAEITVDIFIQTAQELTAQQQLVCDRMSATRPEWALISGVFCMNLPWLRR